jgi:hypothetical protein
MAVTVEPGSAAAADGMPELGVSYSAAGDIGQCGVNGGGFIGDQWVPALNWSIPIRVDTDNRRGGCELAFGIRGDSSALLGLRMTYRWNVVGDGDPTQCGNPGEFAMPINGSSFPGAPHPGFGSRILLDTDDRPGRCDLTFEVAGRSDVSFDMQYWGDGDRSQCVNNTREGVWRSARLGQPMTIGIDTDGRTGGCKLSFRLSRIFG